MIYNLRYIYLEKRFNKTSLVIDDGITNTTPKRRKILSEEESKKVN